MNENLLNWPDFTMVNRVVPKSSFYRNMDANAQVRQRFVENIEQVTWLYKLAPSNLHIADGKDVHEITVFLIHLKQDAKNHIGELLTWIDAQMPRHTLFVLQRDCRFKMVVNYKQWKDMRMGTFNIVKTFATEWMPAESLSMPIMQPSVSSALASRGECPLSSMDALYECMVRHVATTQIASSSQDLSRAVMETKETETIRKTMEAIKKKEAKERQPQKKFALHQEYLKWKERLEKVGK